MNQLPSSKVSWLQSLPNQLTLGRICAIPLLLGLYPLNFQITNVICALVFALAGITDILDGYVARRFGQETPMGALLDPIADKMLTGACLILLADTQALPALLCGLLLCREIAVSGFRLIAAEKGKTISVSSFGKLKTIVQDVGIFCLLMKDDFFDIQFRLVGMICIWSALFISYYSAYQYLQDFLSIAENPEDSSV